SGAAEPRLPRPRARVGDSRDTRRARDRRRAPQVRRAAPGATAAHRRRLMILAWVNDICEALSAFVVGMRTTARFFLENLRGGAGATGVTRQYPEQPAEVIGTRVRGHLFNDAPICIVCHACDKVCPVDCFVMEAERDENNKQRASRFDIDLSKCIYCGL